MKPSPLLSKPTFVSQFGVGHRPAYETAVADRVREFFSLRFPWASEKQKEEFMQQDGELLPVLLCPKAPEDRAEVAAEFALLGFAFDDIIEAAAQDKAVKMVEGMKRVIMDGRLPQDTIEGIAHELRSRMLAMGNSHTRGLANSAFNRIAKAMDLIINRTERHKVLEQGLECYLEYRRIDVGFWIALGLHAWETDLSPPPDHVLEDPDFDMLLALAADHVTLINDMYSYRREAFGGSGIADGNGGLLEQDEHYVFNAVCILLREEGVDETNVMDRLGEQICKKESDFTKVSEKLRVRFTDHTEDLDSIQAWTEIFAQWMGANYYWSTICRRYNKLDEFLASNE